MKVFIMKKRHMVLILFLLVILIGAVICIRRSRLKVSGVYLPVSNKIIAIDPGHGGFDPGAMDRKGNQEDDINLEISLKLKKLIEQSGGVAIITRIEDKGLDTEKSKTYNQKKNEDLRNRRILINESEPHILISIHLNSFPQSKYYGAQTFYKKGCEKSKYLAKIIQQELVNVLDENNKRKPQSRDNIYLIRETDAPAVLIECGFLSNEREAELLNSSEYQDKVAWAIYIGTIRYFNEYVD
ncbi:N-acetylmuramoyl-L-alanine amidase CwlD [Clostridiisalibacter paucivorans]|uniref:N-acetylmuramoyl-L-alanine amidase CwlD n=1 Tax=Clostridiisalibacter paucivorans TaxID=408753 RepID=UPI00047D625A|nr:N-acetylmuramoyl-L-alanine amidase CwlD [Clostridiisalibacter paucivorans]